MIIYPISEAIENLLASAVDEETGEVLLTEEELQEQLERLQIDFDQKIVELRNAYINLTAEAAALKAEKLNLAERQSKAEKAAERTKRFLAYLLKGEKFQSGVCKIGWRKSEELVCDDGFVEWASEHCPYYLNFRQPEPRKADLKQAIKQGTKFQFVSLVEKNNIQIK